MAKTKSGRYGKYGELKRFERLKVKQSEHKNDRPIIQIDKQRKIAPGHTNQGKR